MSIRGEHVRMNMLGTFIEKFISHLKERLRLITPSQLCEASDHLLCLKTQISIVNKDDQIRFS